MDDSLTFLDALGATLTQVSAYNSLNEIPPVAVLWPDEARSWEPIAPLLRQRLPVLTLGPYNPEAAAGPPAWLRCALAGALDTRPPADGTPIVYLPGVSGEQLRNIERLSHTLNLLAELCYRSILWSHSDGADWTPFEFLTGKRLPDDARYPGDDPMLVIQDFLSRPARTQTTESAWYKWSAYRHPGLGIEVRPDPETRAALKRALPSLATMTIAQLRADAPWKAKDFDALTTERETRIARLIAQGESARLEFKATARVDVSTGQKFSVLESVIVKTVAAFLNSAHGGTLLIGVNDDGSVRGIEADYAAWSKAADRNRDKYELWLMKLLQDSYGRQFGPYIHVTFHDVEDKAVCCVTVEPAPQPVFVTEGNDERFYVRMGGSSPWLKLSEALDYIRNRWGANTKSGPSAKPDGGDS